MREVFDEFNSEIESDNEDSASDNFERRLLNLTDDPDFAEDMEGSKIMRKINSHMKGKLVVAPSSFNKEDFWTFCIKNRALSLIILQSKKLHHK